MARKKVVWESTKRKKRTKRVRASAKEEDLFHDPLEVKDDHRRIIESNREIYEVWFKEWLVSCVPSLVDRPKWFVTDRNICVGDVVLFLKSEQEFDRHYQYGIVTTTYEGKDGIVRVVEVEYQNSSESIKRTTETWCQGLSCHP